MNPIVIMGAVGLETEGLVAALEHPAPVPHPALKAIRGSIAGRPVVVCTGGIGKANAALAAAAMIERSQPRLVINVGCAGAYHGSGLAVGDIAIADEEIFGDEGVLTAGGWLDIQAMGLPLVRQSEQCWYHRIPLSLGHADAAAQLAAAQGWSVVRGSFVTVSTCSGTLPAGAALSDRHSAIVENMEGAAVALACLRYGIDCLEIRGISNMVEERDLKNWNIPLAVEAAAKFVLQYVASRS